MTLSEIITTLGIFLFFAWNLGWTLADNLPAFRKYRWARRMISLLLTLITAVSFLATLVDENTHSSTVRQTCNALGFF